MKLENVNIAVIGLGYVGLPLAVEFGKKEMLSALIFNKNALMNWQVARITH